MSRRQRTKSSSETLSDAEDDATVEEVYAQHGSINESLEEHKSNISKKFESEPSRYFGDKILNALFDSLLISVAPELCPAVLSYEKKIKSGEKPDPEWEEAVSRMKIRNPWTHRDSLEEDSIFSLGKILASPRYGQYPDLSDDDDDHVFKQHLSLPHDTLESQDPLSLPTIRPVNIFLKISGWMNSSGSKLFF